MRNWNSILHAFLLSMFFGFVGWFLIEFGFLNPTTPSAASTIVEITATGQMTGDSQGAEVWFYGASTIGSNKEIPWDNLTIDQGWEKRGNDYVSYEHQPSKISLVLTEPLQLNFGSHPYSGMVRVRWDGNERDIDLYSNEQQLLSIAVAPGVDYKYAERYPLIVGSFFLFGLLFAIGHLYYERRLPYRTIYFLYLLFSVYLTLAAFFPGVYTNDSAIQLKQAISGNYEDWYPPVMAWFWSVLISVTLHVESLMLFHLLLLVTSGVVWGRVFEKLRMGYMAFFIPMLITSPIIINFSGVVWKDVGFAFSMLLAFGLAGLALTEKRLTVVQSVSIVLLITYAFGFRSNGLFAIFPIAMVLVWHLLNKFKVTISTLKALTISSAASLLFLGIIVTTVQVFSYSILEAEKNYPLQYLEMYDISGVSFHTGKNYFPEYIKNRPDHNFEKVSEEYEKSIFLYGNANNLIFPRERGAPPLLPLTQDALLQQDLKDSWFKAVQSQPFAYFEHRMAVFSSLMSRGLYSSEIPQSEADRKSVLQKNFVDPEVIQFGDYSILGKLSAKKFVFASSARAKGSILYVGWFWLSLLLIELLAGTIFWSKTRAGLVMIILSASGLLYLLPYLIVAPASDFRYLYWSSIAGSVGGVLMVSCIINSLLSPHLGCQKNM